MLAAGELFLGDEEGVRDDLRGVGLDGGRAELGAEDVAEVSSHFQGGDRGVVGCSCELEGPTNDCDSTVLALGIMLLQTRKSSDKLPQ